MHPPVYHYDPKLGSTTDSFRRAAEVHPEAAGPEVAGVFVARVEGETRINTMWGQRQMPWSAEPGTPCVILGYWSDGTVQLRWPAIAGTYRVEGRFPSWVVRADPTTRLAGGGHWLSANDPGNSARRVSPLLIVVVVIVVVVAVALLLPPVRDALGALLER
jgi:hypothetical protein